MAFAFWRDDAQSLATSRRANTDAVLGAYSIGLTRVTVDGYQQCMSTVVALT